MDSLASRMVSNNKVPFSLLFFSVKTIFILFLMVPLVSCSHRMAYQNADFLIAWRVDDYFNLTRQQKAFVKDRINHHQVWHQASEIPRYIDYLKTVKVIVEDGLDRSELVWVFERFQIFKMTLVDHLVDDVMVLLTSLGNEQVVYLQSYFADNLKALEKKVNTPYQEHVRKRYEAVLKQLESWAGELTSSQKDKLTTLNAGIPNAWPLWYDFTVQRQEALLRLIDNARNQQIERDLLFAWLSSPPACEFAPINDAYESMILEIDQMLTKQQRESVIRKLDRYIEKLESIRRDSL